MSLADRLQTTPACIHDTIESAIPYRYRSEVITIFADLASDAPVVRENAILRGHAIASQLKDLAVSQTTPGLYSDVEGSACLKVSTYIYAAMDAARQKAPAPYAEPATDSTQAQLGDAQTEYEKMRDRDSNAWKGAQR